MHTAGLTGKYSSHCCVEAYFYFRFVINQAERARMELERELDDLNERLEEQGGATQAQVQWVYLCIVFFYLFLSPFAKREFVKRVSCDFDKEAKLDWLKIHVSTSVVLCEWRKTRKNLQKLQSRD